jgi:hypothetical protein
MTQRELTPDEEEIVATELLDLFINLQAEIAADLGIERQPDSGDWSDADADRIVAEIDRQFRPVITERFSCSDSTNPSPDPATEA